MPPEPEASPFSIRAPAVPHTVQNYTQRTEHMGTDPTLARTGWTLAALGLQGGNKGTPGADAPSARGTGSQFPWLCCMGQAGVHGARMCPSCCGPKVFQITSDTMTSVTLRCLCRPRAHDLSLLYASDHTEDSEMANKVGMATLRCARMGCLKGKLLNC